jgi:ribosome biogenesis GTPase
MSRGIIIKAIGGFYYVNDGNKNYTCKIRGKLKLKGNGVMVGDYVNFDVLNDDQGVIEDVLPRKNSLIRPKIANVNQGLIVLASKDPDPDFMLLDRLLILMQRAKIEPVICFNKVDLLADDDVVYNYLRDYEDAGFTVVYASAENGKGKEDLSALLAKKITVLAGPSGAGKSSTLNLQHEEFSLEIGNISEKLGRGRHTTRCVELLKLDDGWVADTPGFSRLDLPGDMQLEELASYYPEFKRYAELCRYDGCIHYQEPDCAIKKALADGKISSARYERYLLLLQELVKIREQEYK